MPYEMKKSLMARAKKKGMKVEQKNRYVYGTMAKQKKDKKNG